MSSSCETVCSPECVWEMCVIVWGCDGVMMVRGVREDSRFLLRTA